jgi:hypothetical protein
VFEACNWLPDQPTSESLSEPPSSSKNLGADFRNSLFIIDNGASALFDKCNINPDIGNITLFDLSVTRYEEGKNLPRSELAISNSMLSCEKCLTLTNASVLLDRSSLLFNGILPPVTLVQGTNFTLRDSNVCNPVLKTVPLVIACLDERESLTSNNGLFSTNCKRIFNPTFYRFGDILYPSETWIFQTCGPASYGSFIFMDTSIIALSFDVVVKSFRQSPNLPTLYLYDQQNNEVLRQDLVLGTSHVQFGFDSKPKPMQRAGVYRLQIESEESFLRVEVTITAKKHSIVRHVIDAASALFNTNDRLLVDLLFYDEWGTWDTEAFPIKNYNLSCDGCVGWSSTTQVNSQIIIPQQPTHSSPWRALDLLLYNNDTLVAKKRVVVFSVGWIVPTMLVLVFGSLAVAILTRIRKQQQRALDESLLEDISEGNPPHNPLLDEPQQQQQLQQ